jgi:hypothetical protein
MVRRVVVDLRGGLLPQVVERNGVLSLLIDNGRVRVELRAGVSGASGRSSDAAVRLAAVALQLAYRVRTRR